MWHSRLVLQRLVLQRRSAAVGQAVHSPFQQPALHPSHVQDVQGFADGLVTANGSDLQGVISWSFQHQLTPAAQNIFLDCVTVLEGEPHDWAMRVWEAWWPRQAFTVFKRLQQLSFVSVDRDGKLVVQDVIRSIGRSLLLEAGNGRGPASCFAGSRIWTGFDGEPLGHVQVGLQSGVGNPAR